MTVDPVEECRRLHDRVAELEAAQERLQQRIAAISEEAARADERSRLYSERARRHADTARQFAAELATLRPRLEQVQRHADALIASTSWRMTTPLRAVMRGLHRSTGLRRRARQPDVAAPVETIAEQRARPRRTGPPPPFPLQGELAAHPALLAAPPAALDATVSVVIPTWNAGRELHWLIRKLQAQRGLGGVEIVIVDSGSVDGTPELAASLGCRVTSIDRAAFSHSASRNLGASLATGELLLFMVQDAYPIGDDWLAGLARALLHPAREQDRLAALSCAEFSRADSELIYDSMARSHYEFLGCADGDRLGRLTTIDQEGLRRQGQLSDVACLIPRALFDRFQFRGRYAEDLTLGIRLIEAGYQLGMLSSIRVAHSHNRPASYYIRRIFVDVVFLVDVFPDFSIPTHQDAIGALMASFALAPLLRTLAPGPDGVPARALERVIDRLREAELPRIGAALPPGGDFGLAPLGDWIGRLLAERGVVGRELTPLELRGAAALRDTLAGRLVALHHYIAESWSVADAATMAELSAAVEKTQAMSVGAELAFCHVGDASRGGRDTLLAELKPLLLAGI